MDVGESPRGRIGGMDFISGVALIALGIGAIAYSDDLDLGKMSRIGPGAFIWLASSGLILFGAILCVRSLLHGSETPTGWPWRGVIMVTASILCFSLLLRPAGLLPACFLAYFIAGLAAEKPRPLELAVAGAAMALFCAALFVWGLGMPLPLLPSALNL